MHHVLLVLIALIALGFTNPALAQSPSLLNSLFGQPQSSQSAPAKPTLPPVKAPIQGPPQASPQASPPETVGEIRPDQQQSAVNTANRDSQVFGASLFTGAFAR